MLFSPIFNRQGAVQYTQEPQKASLWRKVRNLATKLLGDMSFTAGSYFTSVRHSEFQNNLQNVDGQQKDIVKRFHHNSGLGGAGTEHYLSCLAKNHESFAYVGDFLSSQDNAKDEAARLTQIMKNNPDATKFAVPVVIKGMARDHIVTFFIDKEQNTIEYYDSKGLTINDRKKARLKADSSQTLSSFYESIKEASGLNNPTVIENVHKHQFDSHNCGVFVLHFIEERVAANLSADVIFQSDVNSFKANGSYRNHMITTLFSEWQKGNNTEYEDVNAEDVFNTLLEDD